MRQGYIDNFEDLREWFFDNKMPRWVIAHGDIKHRQYLADQEDGLMEMEDSWAKMEDVLTRIAKNGGTFTIKVNKGGNGGYTVYFKMAQQGAENRVNGVQSGYPYVGANVDSYIREKLDSQLTIYDLKRKLEDAEMEKQAQSGFWDKIMDRLTESDNFDVLVEKAVNAISGIAMALLMPKPAGATVGISGFQPGATSQAPASDQVDDEMTEHAEAIGQALTRLQAQFPDTSIDVLLTKLANYVESNPSVAKNLFNQFILNQP